MWPPSRLRSTAVTVSLELVYVVILETTSYFFIFSCGVLCVHVTPRFFFLGDVGEAPGKAVGGCPGRGGCGSQRDEGKPYHQWSRKCCLGG